MGPTRKALKRNTMSNSQCEITVAVDLSFDDLMSDKVHTVAFVSVSVLTAIFQVNLG